MVLSLLNASAGVEPTAIDAIRWVESLVWLLTQLGVEGQGKSLPLRTPRAVGRWPEKWNNEAIKGEGDRKTERGRSGRRGIALADGVTPDQQHHARTRALKQRVMVWTTD